MTSADSLILFDASLYPHRSLSARGFRQLMLGLAVLLSLPGLYALSLGFWPIAGFCFAEFFLVCWLFRRNYAHGRAWERVRLTGRDLIVERHSHHGQVRIEKYEATWLRVEIDEPMEGAVQVKLRTNLGEGTVAQCLSPQERRDFAHALRRALSERLQRLRHADAQALSLPAAAVPQ